MAKHDRFGERDEQIARDAGQEKHGHKNNADGECRNKCRNRNLRCAIQNGVLDFLSHAKLRLMFSISTVASSTRMPTASAKPPSVMMLMVSPSALNTMIEVKIESGIETAMISVLRQLPKKDKIINAGEAGGNQRLSHHAVNRRPARRSTGRPEVLCGVAAATLP